MGPKRVSHNANVIIYKKKKKRFNFKKRPNERLGFVRFFFSLRHIWI